MTAACTPLDRNVVNLISTQRAINTDDRIINMTNLLLVLLKMIIVVTIECNKWKYQNFTFNEL